MTVATVHRRSSAEDALIAVSMTQFVNFILRDGPGQLAVVRTIKRQHESGYEVPPDLYKQFRERLVEHHRQAKPKETLDDIATSQREPTRRREYPPLVAGYQKFWGRRTLIWGRPAEGRWEFGGLRINVKPELCLSTSDAEDGESLLIKLYLNKPNEDGESAMNKRRAIIVTHLMRLAIPGLPTHYVPAVLDVRRARVFRAEPPEAARTALLRGHARAFVEIYQGL